MAVYRETVKAHAARGRMMAIRSGQAIALLLLTAGCTSIHDHRGYLIDTSLTNSVLPGVDNRASVEKLLGQPTFKSQFGQPTAYYVSLDTRQKPFQRPRLASGTLLEVSFDAAGNVQRVETANVTKAVRIEPDGHKTPTLGRERSFFEDMFGNIGAVGALPGGAGGQGGGGGGRGPGGTGPNGS